MKTFGIVLLVLVGINSALSLVMWKLMRFAIDAESDDDLFVRLIESGRKRVSYEDLQSYNMVATHVLLRANMCKFIFKYFCFVLWLIGIIETIKENRRKKKLEHEAMLQRLNEINEYMKNRVN